MRESEIYEMKHTLKSLLAQSTERFDFDKIDTIEYLDNDALGLILSVLDPSERAVFVGASSGLWDRRVDVMGRPPLGRTWPEYGSMIKTWRDEVCVPVALGDDSFMFVTNGGKLIKWNNASTAEAGVMHYTRLLETNADISGISTGTEFSAAVTRKGHVYTWGKCEWLGDVGQLGHVPTTWPELNPTQVQALAGRNILSVSAGMDHCLAVDETGVVYSWGNNFNGQCGTRDNDADADVAQPKCVQFLPRARGVSAGAGYSLVVTEDGELYAFGDATFIDAFGESLGSEHARPTPRIVVFPDSVIIVSAVAGDEHALALTQEGDVFAWGKNQHGQLGTWDGPVDDPWDGAEYDTGEDTEDEDGTADRRFPPTRVLISDPDREHNPVIKFRLVATSEDTSGAVAEDGRVFVWGRLHNKRQRRPVDMSSMIATEYVTAISINSKMILGVTREGTLFGCSFTRRAGSGVRFSSERNSFDTPTPSV